MKTDIDLSAFQDIKKCPENSTHFNCSVRRVNYPNYMKNTLKFPFCLTIDSELDLSINSQVPFLIPF